MFTNADLLALKNELATDPHAIAYLPHIPANDEENARLINEIMPTIQVYRYTVPTSELRIDRDEYQATSQADRAWIDLVTRDGSINPAENLEVRNGLLDIFGEGTDTRAHLVAAFKQNASRAEELYRLGVLSESRQVTPSDIANARSAT